MGQDTNNGGPDGASTADGQPDQPRSGPAPAVADGALDDAGQPPVASDDPPSPQGPAPKAANGARDQVIQARDATIANRDATIAQRDRTIDELREASEAKDREIAELQQALADRSGQADEQRQEISARDSENEKLKCENADLKMEIWRLEDQQKQPEAQPASGLANRELPPSQEAEEQPESERRWRQRLPSDTTATAVVGYTGVAAAIATAANYMNGVEAGITTAVAAAIGATIGVVNERRKKGKNDS
jgi:chromosome segregation ATPase